MQQEKRLQGAATGLRIADNILTSVGNSLQKEKLSLALQHGDMVTAGAVLQGCGDTSSLVMQVVKDIIGPISEAQGIAKAVVGVVLTIVNMALTRALNMRRCQELQRLMEDLSPSLHGLMKSLGDRARSLLYQPSMSADERICCRDDVRSLMPPLQSLLSSCSDCAELVGRWNSGGSKVGKFLRQMVLANGYAGDFAAIAVRLNSNMLALSTACASVSVCKLERLQCGVENIVTLMTAAEERDRNELGQQVENLLRNDVQFREEIAVSLEPLRESCVAGFSDVLAVLVRHEAQIKQHFANMEQKIDARFDRLEQKDKMASALFVKIEEAMEAILVLQKAMRELFACAKCLKESLKTLGRCGELLEIMSLSSSVSTCATVLVRHFGQDAQTYATMLKRWAPKWKERGNSFMNSVRLSRLQDMSQSLRDFQERFLAVLCSAETSGMTSTTVDVGAREGSQNDMLLSVLRKGVFTDYGVVRNREARDFWVRWFPGRSEIKWGELVNVLRWDECLCNEEENRRARAFFWLKSEIDQNGDHLVQIQEWNHFTESGQFLVRIKSLCDRCVPDEDADDGCNAPQTVPDKSRDPISAISSQRARDGLTQVHVDVNVSAGKLGMARAVTECVEICILADCTTTMKDALESVCRGILAIAAEAANRKKPLRLAFIGYRDSGDNNPVFVVPFVDKRFDTFVTHVRQQATPCGGGGDAAEDVFCGLERCVSLSWTGRARLVIHVADAPAHGVRYHNFAQRTKPPSWADERDRWDRFPEADVDGRQGRMLMTSLANSAIDYNFLQLAPFTVKMTDAFAMWYNAVRPLAPVQVVPLQGGDVVAQAVLKLSLSMFEKVK